MKSGIMAVSGAKSSQGYTEDRILGGRITLRQPEDGFRAGIDPVFLAAACAAKEGNKVLDVGSGTGAAALCLKARIPGVSLVCLDISAQALEMAKESAELSGLTEDVTFLVCDVLAGKLKHPDQPFDAILTNPPFHDPGSSRAEPGSARARATVLADDDHQKWFATCMAALKSRGSIYTVFRADRIDLLLGILSPLAGDIRLLPLWPKAGAPAKRILVRATKGAKAPVTLLPGIVLHRLDGSYTEAADAILRQAEAIAWDQV